MAMAQDLEMLDSSLLENEKMKSENEALEELMDTVHDLAEQWQLVCERKSCGEPVDETLEAVGDRWNKIR